MRATTFDLFESEDLASEIATFCLWTKTQVQIFHWQVVGAGAHAAHETLDELGEDFQDKMDELIETIMGKGGFRVQIKQLPQIINLPLTAEEQGLQKAIDTTVVDFVDTCLQKYDVEFRKWDDNAANAILDEICVLLNKTKYLLAAK